MNDERIPVKDGVNKIRINCCEHSRRINNKISNHNHENTVNRNFNKNNNVASLKNTQSFCIKK